MALVFFLMSVSFPAFLRILASSDLYFGGKSVLRCAALEEVTQPRQVEWYHEDDLIYVATIQAQRNGLHLLSHAPSASWGGRALFNPKTLSLHLTRLTTHDAGRYTCRVLGPNLENSATETFYVRGPMSEPGLHVESPTVRGPINSSIQSIGPLHEGQSLDIFCTADPAFPQAEVMWYAINDGLQHSSLTMPESGQSHLRIEHLGRRHEGVRLLCCAEDKQSREKTQSASVTLDIYFRPLEITTSNNRVLYAWETSELECVVSGSRPAPEITWLLGQERVIASFTHTSFNGNVTTSSLAFKARPEHDGLSVACRAVNTAFPNDTLEESWKLVVHYAPVVDLYPCSLTTPQRTTVEPDGPTVPSGYNFLAEKTLCLRCSILANPSPNAIRWTKNGRLIEVNSTSSILQIRPPLLPKRHDGRYSCQVRNSVGETNSAPLYANIHYAAEQQGGGFTNFSIFTFRFIGSIMALAAFLVTVLTVFVAWRSGSGLRRNVLDSETVGAK